MADLEPRRSRSVAPGQWPPRRAPRPRPGSPAPSAPGPAARWRPSMRPRPCRAPCKAIGPRRPPPPPSLVKVPAGSSNHHLPRPRWQPDGVDPRAFAPPPAAAMQKFLHPHVALGSPPAFRS
ncbi:uncharacterized protein LOC105605544 [Ovis aries]|uniref:uncharacterized protein LOC105605544 n=1 Tax=Ovis aries TaxID=9940 RepID=UPI0029527BDB|nr:uncharacterized protein LOC105605544 [Ovis aries]